MGHDWGGLAGWWLAARSPERVRRLAILNAPIRMCSSPMRAATRARPSGPSTSGFFVCLGYPIRAQGRIAWLPGHARDAP
ncbi:alpha/beta fold hydrolase [Methylobacterium sp. CM6257]